MDPRYALPTLVLLLAAAVAAPAVRAQDEPWYDHDPLPREMTPEEMLRRHEIGVGFRGTPPPPGPVRNVAEFERSEAVLIRYPLGIPLTLVAALSQHTRVIVTVTGTSQRNQATSAFQGAGVNMANVDFLTAPTNSVWTRDYGPFYVADGNGEISIVDFTYNRPRADDDALPAALGAHLGMDVYSMDVVHTGGNYMTNSRGASASSDLIWEENPMGQAAVRQRMQDYLGVAPYLVTIDPQDSYLKHIDCWGKFLDVDKILIAEVPPSDPHYADHEAVAAWFATQTSPYGTPYQVFRAYAPAGEPYTNSLILNDRVFVPVVGGASAARDAAALQVYRDAMPGYTVEGFTSSGANAWLSTDALHCRVKEVPDRGMLSLLHTPPLPEIAYQANLTLDVDVVAHSGQPLLSDQMFLIYRTADAAPFDTLALGHTTGPTYSASIPVPAAGAEVTYYFSAADASGRVERFPLVGPPGARSVTVLPATVAAAPGATAGGLRLDDVAPNPSAGGVSVGYALDAAGPVTLEVLDLLGRRIALLQEGPVAAGTHRARWEPNGSPAGVYVVRLSGGGEQAVRRVTLLR